MCPAEPSLSVKDETLATQAIVSSGEKFLEIQPGLAVCMSTSTDLEAANTEVSFPGDREYIHLNCLLQGKFEAQVKDVSLQCGVGDISMGFSDGEMFHTKHCHDFRNLALMIKPQVLCDLAGEELAGISLDKEVPFFVKTASPNQRVTSSAMQVASLLEQAPQKHLLLHSATLDYLYWHLNALQSNKSGETISSRERKQLIAAKQHLLNDLSAPPTIAELASAVGLNQCKLKKGFKSMFGTSIYARFQEERMHKAMHLLKNNNVTETAMTLGYSNVSHFSTAFRKQFGVLPKEARREMAPDLVPVFDHS